MIYAASVLAIRERRGFYDSHHTLFSFACDNDPEAVEFIREEAARKYPATRGWSRIHPLGVNISTGDNLPLAAAQPGGN